MLYVLYDIVDMHYDITVICHWCSLTVYSIYDITYDMFFSPIQGSKFLGHLS